MSQIIMVGCDLHDRSMLLRMAAGGGESDERSFAKYGPRRMAMLEHLFAFGRRHGARRIVFSYEASGQGYGLCDRLTELGDMTRFDNRRQVAAYLGLCPSSSESGDANDRKGHITHQGPGRVRKVLCQAAWVAVRTGAVTRATWERIKRGSPKRGKKAIVAVMRQMAIRLWHVALSHGTPAVILPALAWLSLVGLLLSRARRCFARR